MKYRLAVAALLLVSSAPLLADQPLLKQPGRWAQDYTGRKADPSVRFGTLPNGLRYAIMHNETPSDGVAMRMRIGSGSLEERDEEQGLAHFLEHMAFRGSANVPDGEVVHMLERQGLSFGPDTNATTTDTQTVFMFNFPKGDATALDTGLKLFREIGDRLTLAPAAIDAEKGVVLSEERLRDTPQLRTIKADLNAVLDGTRATDRWVIGKVDTIKAANHDRLNRYYRANYRPDNATIVVVGNIDPATVEKKIIAAFSDWKASGSPDSIDLGAPSGKKSIAEYVGPGAPDQLALSWVQPDDKRVDTEAVAREKLLKVLALQVLNQRLADRGLKPGSPFVGAQAHAIPSLFHSASVTEIQIAVTPGKWRDALDAVTAEQRMLLRDGVQAPELQRATTAIHALLEAKAAAASTRKSPNIADAIVNCADVDGVCESDAQALAFATPLLAKVTPAEVDATLKSLFAAGGPLLFRSAGQGAIGEPQLAQALSASYSHPLGAEVKQAAITWPYTDFGKPSPVVSKTVDTQLGTTTVRFANGTRLLVKPTKFEKDRIQVAVSFGNGRAGVAPQLARKLWQTSLYPLGGTGKLSVAEITQWAQMTGKVESVKLEAGTRSFMLSGLTRPADLLSQMQLLAAYARDPGFRPEAVDKARSVGAMMKGQMEANAGAVYSRGAQSLLVGGDPRFVLIPGPADLLNVQAGDLQSLLGRPLGTEADVVMVGDVSVDDAIKVTEATFAAGEAGKVDTVAAPSVTIRPAAAPAVFEHKGRADQAFYGEYYVLPDYFADPKVSAVAQVAAAIVETRLVDTVREKLGMTYSPQVSALSALELRGEGYFTAMIETPPANFASFHTLLADQLRDLAAKPVGADELARAKQPLIEAQRKSQETNGYWLAKLTQMTREPRVRDEALSKIDRLSAVTAADVQALVARFIVAKQPIVAIARAEQQSPTSGGGSATGAKQ